MSDVLLASGGLDSAVIAGMLPRPAIHLHVRYGQRNWIQERSASQKVADHYSAERIEVTFNDFAWLAAADAVYRMDGESPGADREVAMANELGIPVVYSLDELVEGMGGVRNIGLICSIDECDIPARAKGMCNKHYLRVYFHGRTDLLVPPTDAEVFAANTKRGKIPKGRRDLGPCLLWTGALHSSGKTGYGWFRGKELAHRQSYTMYVGPIPDGLTVDHLCFVRLCVRPSHLEAVPIGENVRRGNSPSMISSRTERCVKRNHPMTGANLYVVEATGAKRCLACVAIREGKPYEHFLI